MCVYNHLESFIMMILGMLYYWIHIIPSGIYGCVWKKKRPAPKNPKALILDFDKAWFGFDISDIHQ